MSLNHELAYAITFNQDVGQMIVLNAFAQQYRGFLEHMIALEDIRCITQGQNRYVLLNEIEPYSPVDLDEVFADTMLPLVDPGFQLACAVAQSKKNELVGEARSRLPDFVEGWASSVEGTTSTDPFIAGTSRSTLYDFWKEVAFISAHLAGAAGTEKARAALAIVSDRVCTDEADSYFDEIHKTFLLIAAPQLASEFKRISTPGKGRLVVPQKHQPLALRILSALIATFSGYRGNPEGSETPRSIMTRYLAVARLDLAN